MSVWGDPWWILQLSARGVEPGTAAVAVLVIIVSFSLIGKWLKAGARPALLIEDGRVDGVVLRRCRVRDEQLREALERNGIATFAEVERAYIDHDGVITVHARRHADCWVLQHAP